MSENKKGQHLEPIETASPEVKTIMVNVLKLERDHLYQNKPRILTDILTVIREAVK